MTITPGFHILILVWFFGWAFLTLRFPVQTHRVATCGRPLTPRQAKMQKIVGYMCLFFGCIFVIGIVR